ncbi:MAG: ribose 5-phosphate isomerase B [Halanaerobiales bacterium]
MPNLVFVCTGNTCRSPIAERLFKKMVEEYGLQDDWQVSSAGIAAFPGQTASREAISVLRETGIDLTNHSSRQLTYDIIMKADLILTMTTRHKELINHQFSDENIRIYTLKEFAGEEDNLDIIDPFAQSEKKYRETREEIGMYIKKILGRLNQFDFEAGNFNKIQNNYVRGEEYLKVAIGSDHAGYGMKMKIVEYLQQENYEVIDMGTDSEQSVDYPDYGYKVARAVAENRCERGILICGTGIGMAITANKVKGIRAALCHDVYSARATRNHNNSNVLTMGARVIGSGLALEIVRVWLGEEFSAGRHQKRINKIGNIERGEYTRDE